MGQQLSQAGKEALDAFRKLSTPEKGRFIALASRDLAAEIAKKASTASPKQRAKASSRIVDGVQAVRAHGFKQVRAPDGTAAIEVKITRPSGEEVTCLLSEGARGRWDVELADYGKNELKGATLLSHDDFTAVLDSLLKAIKGLKVVNRVLQTEDEALQQACQIVKEGVRRDGGCSWAIFDLDAGGAVVGRRVFDTVFNARVGNVFLSSCALFVASPAESK